MATRIDFDQGALRKLERGKAVTDALEKTGRDVADQANANAEQLFTDRGGGGVGSLETQVVEDTDGVIAKLVYPPEHFYMWFGELGTEHQRARPHVRPALYAKREGARTDG